jgi:hypothetical protein
VFLLSFSIPVAARLCTLPTRRRWRACLLHRRRCRGFSFSVESASRAPISFLHLSLLILIICALLSFFFFFFFCPLFSYGSPNCTRFAFLKSSILSLQTLNHLDTDRGLVVTSSIALLAPAPVDKIGENVRRQLGTDVQVLSSQLSTHLRVPLQLTVYSG